MPVRCQDGTVEWIAPFELTREENPPVAVATPRPDFDAGLMQFLIGVMQTIMTPDEGSEWRKSFKSPPSPESLRKKMASVKQAFNLNGDGPRFMQDLTLNKDEAGLTETDIGGLLIDAPGGITRVENRDLFVRRDLVSALGYPMAALALLVLQTNSPAGGPGFRTSIRGGGPLSVFLIGETLWKTVWLNVLTSPLLRQSGNAKRTKLDALFPWMAPTRASDKEGVSTTLEDIHPVQSYWAMPRRIRLDLPSVPARGTCALSGVQDTAVVKSYRQKNYGVKYEGNFRHPLTAYSRPKVTDAWNSKKAQPSGLSYRDWPQLHESGEGHLPPLVVKAAQDSDLRGAAQRLWFCGYDMENAKACCWYSSVTPWVDIGAADWPQLVAFANQLVEVSDEVRTTLRQQLKAALSRRPNDLKFDALPLEQVNRRFWSETERDFYVALQLVSKNVSDTAVVRTAAEQWLKTLNATALALFEEASQERGQFSATDIKRVSQAWSALRRYTSPRNNALRKLIGLPLVTPSPEARHAASGT